MNGWMFLWKAVLILSLLAFGGMAVWVTIGGFRDIKRLFARIEQAHAESADDEKEQS